MNLKLWRLLTGCLICLIASCQAEVSSFTPSAESTAVADLELWQVQVTSSMVWIIPDMNACLEKSTYALVVQESPQSALDLSESDFIFHWGETGLDAEVVYQLGWQRMAVIVNDRNPLQEVSQENLRLIYSGAVNNWSELTPNFSEAVNPWSYPPGEDVSRNLIKTLTLDFLTPRTGLAPDPTAMQEVVAGDPGAIGFLPHKMIDDTIQTLSVTDSADSYQYPVLVSGSEDTFTADQNDWLLCIQERIK